MRGISNSKINFDHPIQRRAGQWDDTQKSLLIHSILSDFPVPAIYAIQEETLSVIDGKQRLTNINDFIDEKYALSADTPEVNIDGEIIEIAGKKFSDLTEDLQSEIINFNFQTYVFSDYVDDEVEEVFFRLNNGTPLTKDQKTRVRLGERLSLFVDEVCEMPLFKEKAYFSKLQLKRGEDQTCILQALMLITEYDFKDFNNDSVLEFVEHYRNNYKETELNYAKELFKKLNDAFAGVTKPNKIIKKINIPMFISTLHCAVESEAELSKYNEWANEFINEYSPNSTYAGLCGAGSTGRKKVESRIDYMFNSFEDFYNRVPIGKKEDEFVEQAC
jgi:hypothetical protein